MMSVIVLIGDAARNVRHIQSLVTGGSVVVLAPSVESAGRWLLRSASRRHRSAASHDVIAADELVIDLTSHKAMWAGRILPLSDRELHLLGLLAQDPGRAWSFAELTDRVWGSPYYGDRGPVRAAVQRLRGKLWDAGVDVTVEAVRGVGFRLELPNAPDAWLEPTLRLEAALPPEALRSSRR
jgi:DNA-binding response OmpR family regulator